MKLRIPAPALAATGSVLAAAAIAVSGAMAVAAAPAAPRATVSGTEHFQFISASPTSSKLSLIASGAFTASGVVHDGPNNVAKFVFAHGTITFKHTAGTGTHSLNPKTCLLTLNLHGTYKLLDGTGKYAGITGHGTYQASLLAILAKSGGKCSQAAPPVAFQRVIRASGPLTL
jgi:hypothetical protein